MFIYLLSLIKKYIGSEIVLLPMLGHLHSGPLPQGPGSLSLCVPHRHHSADQEGGVEEHHLRASEQRSTVIVRIKLEM